MSEIVAHLTGIAYEPYEYIFATLAERADSCTCTACGVSAVFSGSGEGRVLLVMPFSDPALTAVSVKDGALRLTGDEAALKRVNHGTPIIWGENLAVVTGEVKDGEVSARLINGEVSVGDVLSPDSVFTVGSVGSTETVSGALEGSRAAAAAVLAFAEDLTSPEPTVEVLFTRDVTREGITEGRADLAICVGTAEGKAGDGVIHRVKDRGFSPDAPLRERIASLGETAGIKLKPAAFAESGIGAAVTRLGIQTAEFDLPTEFCGSPWELVAIDDAKELAKALEAAVKLG